MWTADINTFIPAQTEPGQRIYDCLIGLLRVTSRISILDAEDELATSVAGISPVKQGSSHHTNMRSTSGRRAKAYAYFLSHTDNVRPTSPDDSTKAMALIGEFDSRWGTSKWR